MNKFLWYIIPLVASTVFAADYNDGFGPQIEGWPEMNVIIIHVAPGASERLCTFAVTRPLIGCADVDFDNKLCVAYVDDDNESATTEKHERKHCAGYDHAGETTLHENLERWKWQKAGRIKP